jgi:ATPase family AAA domain-containing protein 3A/B
MSAANSDWQRVKKLIQDEQELLQIMAELPEEDFEALMTSSKRYAKALEAKYKALAAENQRGAELQRSERMRSEMAHKERLEQQRLAHKHREMQEETQRQLKLVERQAAEDMKVAQYKSQLELDTTSEKTRRKMEAQLQYQELEANRLANEERLARAKHQLDQQARDAEFLRERELRLALESQRGKDERETKLALAERAVGDDLARHEAMKDYLLEKDLKMHEIDANKDVRKEEIKMRAMQDFFAGTEGRRRMINGGLFVCVSVGSFFLFRNVAAPFLAQWVRKRFFRPKLISRSVRYSPLGRALLSRGIDAPKSLLANVSGGSAGGPSKHGGGPRVVLQPELESRMEAVIRGTRNTARRGGLFSHMMLHGKPGTGKTLFAERLAAESHMDFAVMSGPSFTQFEPGEAIAEIKNLFAWANASPHGLLLFVDEADSFLEDRSTMHPHRVAVLNEWINLTGTESRRFMCIYETNRPEVLDPAIQSRVTQSIEFPAPEIAELGALLRHYVELYLHNDAQERVGVRRFFPFAATPEAIGAPALRDEATLDSIAERIAAAGFVGRDVTNLVISLLQTAYASDSFALAEADIDRVVAQQIDKKKSERIFLDERDKRIDLYRRLLK